MSRRRFTRSETIALCTLLIALLVTLWIMMPHGGTDKELAAVAAADSVYRAKADSLDAVADSLRNRALVRKAAARDSIRQRRRRKKNAPKPKYTEPRQRDYRGEQLSPSQQR